MAINITKHALNEESVVHILDAAGNKLYDGESPVTITIFGKASAAYRNSVADFARKSELRGDKKSSFEDMVAEGIEHLVALSKTSSNLEIDGELVTTSEAFRKLYTNEGLYFIRDQLNTVLGSNAGFLPK